MQRAACIEGGVVIPINMETVKACASEHGCGLMEAKSILLKKNHQERVDQLLAEVETATSVIQLKAALKYVLRSVR
jgi:hypothetical protein